MRAIRVDYRSSCATSGVAPRTWRLIAAGLWLLCAAAPAVAGREPFAASTAAIELDQQIDWSGARLIAVQDAGRYKTLESFARESLTAMYGRESLPGLSALASLLELLFNGDAYADTPMIRVKDQGLRIHFTAQMPEVQRQHIRTTGYMTPREFNDPVVAQRIAELEPRFEMSRAINRVRNAEAVASFLDQMIRIVPRPGDDATARWYTPRELLANVAGELGQRGEVNPSAVFQTVGRPVGGFTSEQAMQVVAPWAALRKAWLEQDAAGVQRNLKRLADTLPTLASPRVYPRQSQRQAEVNYYAWGKFTWGYWIYFLGALISVWAVVTRWRTPWAIALTLLVIALGLHAYGIALRWYILGRIPVANMFEAIVASAWVGIAIALLIELAYRSRVFLFGAHATGFFALVLASQVLPGALTTMMGILDDLMLRIHTVLIIASYALIFLAAVIAAVYLFGYYFHKQPARSAEVGVITAFFGTALWLVRSFVFEASGAQASGVAKVELATWITGFVGLAALVLLIVLSRVRAPSFVPAALANLAVVCAALTFGNHGFSVGLGATMLGGGLAWAAANGVGLLLRGRVATAAGFPALALAGADGRDVTMLDRPVLAGGAPGDERSGEKLPAWLHQIDWGHLIILNMMFVMLFVGVILGAVWADYSWGRPWGWDPKEVFALNTWIIYAILIHARFVVKNKGLWTAWLSVAGCLMMAFNWAVVNFYIVGLHSYA